MTTYQLQFKQFDEPWKDVLNDVHYQPKHETEEAAHKALLDAYEYQSLRGLAKSMFRIVKRTTSDWQVRYRSNQFLLGTFPTEIEALRFAIRQALPCVVMTEEKEEVI